MTGHGKRNSPRINRRLTVRFGSEKLEYLGFTIDVSAEGLFIGANTVFRSGGVLHVQLTTRNGSNILLRGEIRWAQKMPAQYAHKVKSGMGLRIIEIIEGRELYETLYPRD
jgi:hypothetical protein